MPPRSAKMKRRIFGFQRRVWWPKWTPASSRSRMETAPGLVETAMKAPSRLVLVLRRRESEAHLRTLWSDIGGTRAAALAAGEWEQDAGRLAGPRRFQRGGEVGGQRRGN